MDTSAIIYLNDFRKFDEIIITPSVIKEVKDKVSLFKLASLKNFKILEPSHKSIKEVEKIARVTGDIEQLSKTDLEVLALAKEFNVAIISDDKSIQNVAEKMRLKYLSIFSKKISKLIIWREFCRFCKKYYERKKVCPVCGNKLIRVPKKQIEIK